MPGTAVARQSFFVMLKSATKSSLTMVPRAEVLAMLSLAVPFRRDIDGKRLIGFRVPIFPHVDDKHFAHLMRREFQFSLRKPAAESARVNPLARLSGSGHVISEFGGTVRVSGPYHFKRERSLIPVAFRLHCVERIRFLTVRRH